MHVFEDIPNDCLVKVNGVEKVAHCNRISERVV